MTLQDYLKIIRKRWVTVAAVIIIGCLAAVWGGPSVSQPTYTAASKIIVGSNQTGEPGKAPNQADVQVNIMLINTFKELILTPPILQEVVRRYPELSVTTPMLAKSLKASSAPGSQVISLSWTDSSYERASHIVNGVTEVFKDKLPSLLDTGNPVALIEASPSDKPIPSTTSSALLLMIGLVISGILAVLLAFLLESLDGRVREAKDVERTIGYPVLVSIATIGKRDVHAAPAPVAAAVSLKRTGEEKHAHVGG